MNISLENTDFLNSFDLLLETTIDKYQRERLSLYALKINANEFNYNNLQEQLVDPMIDYAVSREVKKQYSNRPGALSKKWRQGIFRKLRRLSQKPLPFRQYAAEYVPRKANAKENVSGELRESRFLSANWRDL